MPEDSRQNGSTSGYWLALRFVIPALGLLGASFLGGIALWIAPADGAEGFRRNAEIMKACLTLAVISISAALVSFLISEYGRMTDERRQAAREARLRDEKAADERRQQDEKAADERRQQEEADALERRRLVGELREVHHAVKTAQLRIRAHKTVRTYGIEIRDVIMPKVAQLGGVKSDIGREKRLFPTCDAATTAEVLGDIIAYLEALTNEFEEKYLTASLLQETSYKWRQHRVAELVKGQQFSEAPLTEADLPERDESDVWRHLTSREESGEYRFPRLAIFLEFLDATATTSSGEVDSHQARFSKPQALQP